MINFIINTFIVKYKTAKINITDNKLLRVVKLLIFYIKLQYFFDHIKLQV